MEGDYVWNGKRTILRRDMLPRSVDIIYPVLSTFALKRKSKVPSYVRDFDPFERRRLRDDIVEFLRWL